MPSVPDPFDPAAVFIVACAPTRFITIYLEMKTMCRDMESRRPMARAP